VQLVLNDQVRGLEWHVELQATGHRCPVEADGVSAIDVPEERAHFTLPGKSGELVDGGDHEGRKAPVTDPGVHRYRDALRVRGIKAEAGYIIVPNLQPDAELFGSGSYIAAHRFGALNVYAEGWLDPVLGSLADLGLRNLAGTGLRR